MSHLFNFGYDVFVGRQVGEDGTETNVTLDLHDLISFAYADVLQAVDDIIHYVKKGKRVLLTYAPGEVDWDAPEPVQCFSSVDEVVMQILDRGYLSLEKKTARREYRTLSPEDIQRLRELYEADPAMKSYPNPFMNQPFAN